MMPLAHTGKLEYLHLDFGNASVAAVNSNIAPPIGVELRTHVTDEVVRFGFNYKLDPLGAAEEARIVKSGLPKSGWSPTITKAPAQMAWGWSGYYLGLNLGWGWGKSRTDTLFDDTLGGGGTFAASSSFALNGVVWGAQTGYNWQFGNWLTGVEADVQFTGQRGNPSFVCPGTICNPNGPEVAGFDQNQTLEWFATLRGRVGAAATTRAIVYLTGGVTVGGFNTAGNVAAFDPTGLPATSAFSNISIKPGWTVGAGIEGHIAGNWTGKIEYLYVDFGSISASSNNQLNVASDLTTNSIQQQESWPTTDAAQCHERPSKQLEFACLRRNGGQRRRHARNNHRVSAACSFQVEADRYGQIDALARELRRWWRKRLRAIEQRERLLVEHGSAGAAHDTAVDQASLPIDGKEHLGNTLLVPRLRCSGVTLVTLKQRDDLSPPGRYCVGIVRVNLTLRRGRRNRSCLHGD
jgi:outer membrane immunogenic protein